MQLFLDFTGYNYFADSLEEALGLDYIDFDDDVYTSSWCCL